MNDPVAWICNQIEETFTEMNNRRFDYERFKILKELHYIERGFICKKWYKTTKKGTKAEFIKVDYDKLLERCEIIKKELKKYRFI